MKKFINKIFFVILLLIIASCFIVSKSEAKYNSSYNFQTTTIITNNNQDENNDNEETENTTATIIASYSETDGILTINALDDKLGINKIDIYRDDSYVATYEYNGSMEEILIEYSVDTDFAFYENLYAILTDAIGNTKKSNIIIPNPDKIYDLEDLIRFRNIVNNGVTDFADCTIYLINSIDMSSCENWTPIGNEIYFSGNFEGNSNTISNLYIESENDCVGLFSKLYGAVNELNISGSIISSGNYVGAIAGISCGAITYVKNNVTISSTGSYIGGIVGYNDHGYFAYCGNDAEIKSTGSFVGGITGFTTANPNVIYGVIIFSYNKGTISGYEYVAGLAGAGWDTDCTKYIVSIRASYNQGDITATSGTVNNGGILGGTLYALTGTNDDNSVALRYLYNVGNITSSDDTINQISPQYVSTKYQVQLYYVNTLIDNSGIGISMKTINMTTVGTGSLYAYLNEGDSGKWEVLKDRKYPSLVWENN